VRLRKDINLGTLLALHPASRGWRRNLDEQLLMLRELGYEGAQSWGDFDRIHRAGLIPLGMARATKPAELDDIARRHCDLGVAFTNLHLGTGFESDDALDALADAVLNAQARHKHTLLVETHRATATQDIWRTCRWIARRPMLRFTADLSHWYTGHEMIYGGEFEARRRMLAPVLQRTAAIQGRIGNSGCIQCPLEAPGDQVQHFRALWTEACAGFLAQAQAGDALSFAPELLPMVTGDPPLWLHYQQNQRAADADGWTREPSDRFADAQALWSIAQGCFATARSSQEQGHA
jgi:hypothetical protein